MKFDAAGLVEGIGTLKSLPSAYLNVKKVIENPVSSTNDLARAIGADPALTARLLRLVNSPLYGFSAKIETVSRALVILGMQQVHDLALATAVAALFKSARPQLVDLERFWRESVICSLASRSIAKLCNVLDSERLFVAGLLHGLGHLIMYEQIPEEALNAQRFANDRGLPVDEAEREVLGCDYAQVGGELARRWNLPKTLCSAIEFHVNPKNAPPPALVESIVHIGYWLMRSMVDGTVPEQWAKNVSATAWTATSLTPECYSPVKVQCDAQFDQTLSMLFNGTANVA